ncbi:MAG: SOS response-associated peptidase [Marinilabiliales bacterium]|nr:SOS response-associated peptidase [Marinilabiliales bacterium]
MPVPKPSPTKPAFRESFSSRRCLVPVRGFFEWQHVGGRKIPWYISLRDEEIFSLARHMGFMDYAGRVLRLTPSPLSPPVPMNLWQEIHNTKKRMPVILPATAEKLWLQGRARVR